MEIQGNVHKVLPSVHGSSANGTWKKQELVIVTMEQYPKKIAFEFWGDNCRDLDELKPGNIVKVQFNVESREHEGRWYTTCKAWKMNLVAK